MERSVESTIVTVLNELDGIYKIKQLHLKLLLMRKMFAMLPTGFGKLLSATSHVSLLKMLSLYLI